MVSVEYSEAIVEVLDIIENSDESIYKKIPNKLIQFFEKNKSTTYKPNLDHNKPLNEMHLKEKTKDIITMIYLNYLCEENEKENIIKTLKKNEENYQEVLREKYNPDNIFKNKNTNEKTIEKTEQDLVIYKEKSFFQKIFEKIKGFFRGR